MMLPGSARHLCRRGDVAECAHHFLGFRRMSSNRQTIDEHRSATSRRGFVRLVGGGVILAAGGLGAGCSRQLPPEAIEAWKGPSLTEPDVRRWILAHAILAPHSHNLQSWLVDLRTPGEMLLRCDLERLLPATDPFSRQIMMSHGTFIELLDIAARQRG